MRYSELVISHSPYIYWGFYDASGPSAEDLSGNDNFGTYNGTITFDQDSITPDTSGKSIFISSAGAYCIGPTLSSTVYAAEAWVKVLNLDDSRDILSICYNNSNRVILFQTTDGYIHVYKNSSMSSLVSDSTVSIRQPHHIAIFYKTSTDRTYMMIDGVVQNSSDAGNLLSVSYSPVVYGLAYLYNGSTYARFVGHISDMAFYTSEISEDDLKSHANYVENTYFFSGTVYEKTTPVSRKIHIHRRDTGELVGTTTSSGNGHYYIETTYSGSHYIVALDNDGGESYNAAILDKMIPDPV